jgi:glycosyltransferase involved in cell wall biosynthesis
MNMPPDEQILELSVVMPCLNEAETLARCIEKAQRALVENNIVGEIIIADNGSNDGSQVIAKNLGARVVDVAEKGYGAALMGGIAAARGTYVIMGDADDSYNFLDIPLFLDKLRDGFDLVMGNRFRGGISPGAMPPLHRYLGNPVLSGIGRLFFRCSCKDFHCGLRGFNRNTILNLKLQTTGMEFASEMVVSATLYGLRITEVPTTLSPDGRSRPPHLRSWRDGWRHLRFLLMYSPRWLFLYPGIFFIVIGILMMVRLFLGPFKVGPVVLDIHTMVYSGSLVLVGFQSLLFGVLSKAYALNSGLAPWTPKLERWFNSITLEVGLLSGLLLMGGGIAGIIGTVAYWSSVSFGPLEVVNTMRYTITASVLTVLGCQIILSSFFLSILGIKHK